MNVPSTDSTLGLRRNVYISTKHRNVTKYPSASTFNLELPSVIKKVYAIAIRSFKYTPEPLVNANNNQLSVYYKGNQAGNQTGTSVFTIPKGDYVINDLVFQVNSVLAPLGVVLTVSGNTATFNLQESQITMVILSMCPLLGILGFTSDVALTLLETPTVVAPNEYDLSHDTDLVVRIEGLEAITSVDQSCDRATAVLVSNKQCDGLASYIQEGPYPLLQVQHRLQLLRIKLLNTDGDPYDFTNSDASFMCEFYCLPEIPPCV
jgi:hypothetical protein